jgi:hypothetical protein
MLVLYVSPIIIQFYVMISSKKAVQTVVQTKPALTARKRVQATMQTTVQTKPELTDSHI